jgi:hypothetical protein
LLTIEKVNGREQPRETASPGHTIRRSFGFTLGLNIEVGPYERLSERRLIAVGFNPTEIFMKKILIATTALAFMCGSAFAQSTTSQPDNMGKSGMTNGSMERLYG